MDASAKPDNAAWQNVVNFVRSVASSFNIAQNCVRMAVIRYATTADATIPLNQYNDINSLLSGIQSLTVIGGGSNLATALQILESRVFASNVVRPGARLVAGIVTDRLACNTQITSLAADLKNRRRVTIAGIAVTRTGAVDTSCLSGVASPNMYAAVADYNQLNGYVSRVAQFLCPATQPGPGPGPGPNLQYWGKHSIRNINIRVFCGHSVVIFIR